MHLKKLIPSLEDLLIDEKYTLKTSTKPESIIITLDGPEKQVYGIEHLEKSRIYFGDIPINDNGFIMFCSQFLTFFQDKEGSIPQNQMLSNAGTVFNRILRNAPINKYLHKSYELAQDYVDLPELDHVEKYQIQDLKEKLQKAEGNQHGIDICISNMQLFNFMQEENGMLTLLFTPLKTYRTATPEAEQFKKELAKYSE